MNFDLRNKVVFVTGSSSGIGRAIALAYAREGSRVAITFCAHRPDGEQTAAQVRAEGGTPLVVHYDLADQSSVKSCVDTILAEWCGIDVFVANAVRWPSSRPPS